MDTGDVVVSDEARRRVDTARVRDVAFKIKNLFEGFDDDDAEALARVLLEASETGIAVSADFVYKRLIQLGRSPETAKRVSERFS